MDAAGCKPCLQQTEEDYLILYHARSAECTVLQTHSPGTAQLLAAFSRRGAVSDGPCCPEDWWVRCQQAPRDPGPLPEGSGLPKEPEAVQGGKGYPSRASQLPCMSGRGNGSMINPEHNQPGSQAPLLRLFALYLPVLESPASAAAGLGSVQCHPAPERFRAGMSCGDMAWLSGSSAALPGPP